MNYADFPLSAPVNVTWEITHKCNLRCIHCLSASNEELLDELTFEECVKVVDQLAELKVFEINFGGGEPFLKDFFLDLVRYINAKGMVTCISTNGIFLNKKIISLLANNPLIHVQVSLDGASPETNDRIRGNGTFEKIVSGIRLLATNHIPFSINTVVTSLNCNELNRIQALARDFGGELRISRFRPSGRARSSWNNLKLDKLQLDALSEWLGNHPGVLTGDSFFSISSKERSELGLDLCGACKMTCCIDPRGSVYPCAFLQSEDFWSGNLRMIPFKKIWDESPVFIRFRRLEPDSCKKCPRFNVCHGGCPAVAFYINHTLNSADPECMATWKNDTLV